MLSKPGTLCALFSLVGLFSSSVASGQAYDVTRLNLGPDVASFTAADINNHGHIVGAWSHAGTGEIHGYLYDGQLHDLGVGVYPHAISDDDHVTGEYAGGRAFLYDHASGTFTPLGTLGGTTSVGNGVNDQGMAAGESRMAGGTPNRAFLYADGEMINLGIPTDIGSYITDYTKANDLNDAGLVVGEALVGSASDLWAIPFFYDSTDPGATMHRLSGSYISGSAWALNQLGHIVGWFSHNEDTWGHAFLHDGATLTDLGTIPGKSYTIATDVNNLDVVVGYGFGEWVWADWCGCSVWTTNIQRGFVYRDGAMASLTDMIPADETGSLTHPIAINDSGKILTPLGSETVILSPVVTADPNDDGYLNLDDYATFADCLTGPNTDPAPTLPLLAAHCVQLFDLDRDYDVDTADFAHLQEWMGHPGRIVGTVEYTGSDNGDIYILAKGARAGFEYTAAIVEAGPFLIELWRTDDYAISAFLDANGNGAKDSGEPAAPAQTTPLHVLGERGLVDDVFIDLGPYTLDGQVAYVDGTPAPGVTLTATGPTATSVATGADGAYFFDALLGGNYVITPSDPDRYFYPFNTAVTVVGDDVAGINFEAHDLPTGEVDGDARGVVSAVDLATYSITINVEGQLIVVYVYADTVYSGFASKLQEVTVGHRIEAQFYTPSNLAVHIDTDP